MVQPVITNSAAGLPHPDDPALKVQLTIPVSSSGLPAVAGSGSHVFAYANGLLATDTWTLGTGVYVQTYTYANGVISTVSDWVKQ